MKKWCSGFSIFMLHNAGNWSIYNGVHYPEKTNLRGKEAGSPQQRASPPCWIPILVSLLCSHCSPSKLQLPAYSAVRPNTGRATSPIIHTPGMGGFWGVKYMGCCSLFVPGELFQRMFAGLRAGMRQEGKALIWPGVFLAGSREAADPRFRITPSRERLFSIQHCSGPWPRARSLTSQP